MAQSTSTAAAGTIQRVAGAAVALAALLVVGLMAMPAAALPLYARQTGLPCASRHTPFPELTPFGLRFKLGSYTLQGGKSTLPPSAVMLQPTFNSTATGNRAALRPLCGSMRAPACNTRFVTSSTAPPAMSMAWPQRPGHNTLLLYAWTMF